VVVVESVHQGAVVIIGMCILILAQTRSPQIVRQIDNHFCGVALMSVSLGGSLEKVHI